MASSSGLSSIYHKIPSLELLPRKTTTPSLPFSFTSLSRLRYSAGVGVGGSAFLASAVATPNSGLREEAFQGLGVFDQDSSLDNAGDSEYDDGSGELAITKLGLPQRLVQSLAKREITKLFPIQRAVLVPALEGRDIIARAKTGTGKTLAFGIPIIKRLTEDDEERNSPRRVGRLPRVLVLAPTRELAKQVETEIKESAPYLSTVCVYGGVSYNSQQDALYRGVDVVVGTPGRLIDLIKSDSLKLQRVQFLVLDEADRMLAVGFEEDVELILQQLPSQRQSMLFSATMPGWVKQLSRRYLNTPLTIDLVGDQDEKLAEGIKLYAIQTTSTSKQAVLADLVTVFAKGGKTIVFTQTKRDANEVSIALTSNVTSEALHGDITQFKRERTLNGFRKGKFTVLVATDVASRGLDIPNVDLVIHYEVPNDPETFVHRSGRTGRAGKEGTTILMFKSSQRRTIGSLERDVGCKFDFISPPALAAAIAQLSGLFGPPSSRSLITHEQGWTTLQLTRDSTLTRGLMSARIAIGFLAEVYATAADKLGKIHMIADERVQGAVFDLPEEIANELLNKEIPPGSTITEITKLPELQDDGPAGDFYGRSFTNRNSSGGGSRRGGSGGSRGWGNSRDEGDSYRQGGRGGGSSWSRGGSRTGGSDWLIGERRSSSSRSPSFGNRDRDFAGACFNCGQFGHRASECPK